MWWVKPDRVGSGVSGGELEQAAAVFEFWCQTSYLENSGHVSGRLRVSSFLSCETGMMMPTPVCVVRAESRKFEKPASNEAGK